MKTPLPPDGPLEPEFLLLPEAGTLFIGRAARFRRVAGQSTALAGYLELMAGLAEIQQGLALDFQVPCLPEPVTGRPPLDISRGGRDPVWREMLREMARGCRKTASEPLAAALERIHGATDSGIETWADGLFRADFQGLDRAIAPFVAAALQVHWTNQAARLVPAALTFQEPAFRCPVCGSLPVASVLRTGSAAPGLRYLCCSLCAAEWRRVRIHCVHCGSSKGVAYFGIEGAGRAVRAEACADCKSYLKVMDREKDPAVDPFADDIATLALDILMADEGYERLGFNPLLIPGT